jgi:DNA polymerase V
MKPVVALVDCRAFYVSCERVFNAAIRQKPVIVLGNNDGIIVALSQEAKALGLRRGQAAFQCREIIETHAVASFSSNYQLYADLSSRVMATLAAFTSAMEVYSIDEAYLDLSHVEASALTEYGRTIQQTVLLHTGIPTTVAITTTKTLAKIAAEIIKQEASCEGVLSIADWTEGQIDVLLERVSVADIWGIGPRKALMLSAHSIFTAKQFKEVRTPWIRKHLHVTGVRTQYELRGIQAIPLETTPKPKKNLACALNFGRPIQFLEELAEAAATYVATVAQRLRRQHSLAGSLTVFIQTSRFQTNAPQYSNSRSKTILFPTAFTPDLINEALQLLHEIFRPGYMYRKAGVLLGKIVPQDTLQGDLFDLFSLELHEKKARLMESVDLINETWGNNTLFFGAQGIQRDWKMRQAKRSPRFTTQWEELFSVT